MINLPFKTKKIKTKNPDIDNIMKTTSDSFQRIQRDMQRRSKGKAKGYQPKEQFAGRIQSFKKKKMKSMQKSRKSI